MQPLHILHHSHHHFYRRFILCLLSAGLLLIATACGASVETGTPAPSPTKVTTSTPTSPAIIPNCPAPGTALAASMPSLQLGTRANIVYFRNQIDRSPAAVFYRYDVQTASTTMIAVEKQVTVLDAQLSRDGQWILFTAQFGQQTMFQLVRIDGKQLQTLYCAAPGTRIITQGSRGTTSPTQWSPDAKHMVFLQGASMASSQMKLLTLASGSLQALLPAGSAYYQPRTWMDNTRIYVSNGQVAPAAMFMLDTSNVAKGLQLVVGVGDTLWDFDSTYDASKLYITHYDGSQRVAPGIYCTIEAQPAAQPVGKLIFNSKTMLVVSVRVIGYGSSALLLSVANTSDSSYNGLWKMNVDGSGLMRLTSTAGGLNQFTQYPWSNFSRDGKFYTVSNSYGSLSGGKLTQFASSGAVLVGWTTV